MTTDIALPRPTQIGQATAIEQSRAVAEVYAAIMVAQQAPRNVQAAISAMRQSCAMAALAERAFFRFPRAGGTVSGASVHLARELARCWGNIQYGIAELRRDDDAGESEMQAYAWDVETNARSATIFVVPHKRDKTGGPVRLTDMRDIYENNANAGARRVRECIFAVLPPWFVEEAKELCTKTITDGTNGGSKPIALPQRIANVLGKFEQLGVTEDDVTRRLGRPSSKWTAHDVAQLVVIGKSIEQGTVSRDEEFPPPTVTAEEITAPRPPAAEAAPAAESPGDSAPAALIAKVKNQLVKVGVSKPQEQLDVLGQIAGRQLATWPEVTTETGQRAAELLVRAGHADDPGRALDALLAELHTERGDRS